MALIREHFTRDVGDFLAYTRTFLNPDGTPRIFDNCTFSISLNAQAGDGNPLATVTSATPSNGYFGFDTNGTAWFFIAPSVLRTLGRTTPFIHMLWVCVGADGVTSDDLMSATITLVSR